MISTVLKENSAEKYLENLSELSFKIELAAVDNQKSFEFLKVMNDASIEKAGNSPKISFCLGLSKKFDAILILLETIKESGFENAFIRAYWDGFPIENEKFDDSTTIDLIRTQPELQKFKEYQQKLGK